MLTVMALLLSAGAIPPENPEGTLIFEQAIAAQFAGRMHIATLPFSVAPPKVEINTTPMLSYTDGETIHEARFAQLPPQIKALFDQWAQFTTDQKSGNTLFDAMFYRFFFVHELGHWAIGEVLDHRQDAARDNAIKNAIGNHWQAELECNRISVAWWREHDPAFLAKIIGDFRAIQAKLPNPVPAGQNAQKYFADNYEQLGRNPQAYGWFLLQSVILANDEPVKSFQQVLDELPARDFADS
jgi:hypothetical protein